MSIHDYESWGYIDFSRSRPELLETFAGKAIVLWHGKIEGQLKNLLDDAEKGRNFPYTDKVREFLKIWRSNEITGSINREQLETLKAAADMLSVDNWNLSSYFRTLRDQLRVLVASEEELPRDVDMNQNDPYAGGGGGHGGGAPPMDPAFGPQGEEGEEGGGGGGMPGGGGPGGEGGPGGGPGEMPPGGPEGGPEAGAEGGPEGGAPGSGMPGEMPPGEEGDIPGAPGEEEGPASGEVNPEDMPDEKRFGEM